LSATFLCLTFPQLLCPRPMRSTCYSVWVQFYVWLETHARTHIHIHAHTLTSGGWVFPSSKKGGGVRRKHLTLYVFSFPLHPLNQTDVRVWLTNAVDNINVCAWVHWYNFVLWQGPRGFWFFNLFPLFFGKRGHLINTRHIFLPILDPLFPHVSFCNTSSDPPPPYDVSGIF